LALVLGALVQGVDFETHWLPPIFGVLGPRSRSGAVVLMTLFPHDVRVLVGLGRALCVGFFWLLYFFGVVWVSPVCDSKLAILLGLRWPPLISSLVDFLMLTQTLEINNGLTSG